MVAGSEPLNGWSGMPFVNPSFGGGRRLKSSRNITQLGEGKACKGIDPEGRPCIDRVLINTKTTPVSKQYSRRGKSAITFFVSAEAKPKIRAALADAGYGCSYQEGITNMLQDLLEQQGRDSKL